jgi:hypothetical protein
MAGKQGQELFFDFLQQCERANRKFNKEQIIAATGWKPATFKTYFGKGQITQFVSDIGANQFEAINTLDITYVEFKKRLSQSKHYQELGHKCKSNLAKALLKKSRDNMMLALELYNRPSLENKLDGFVLLFCTAWEQLCKARLIEKDGEESIFEATGKKGTRRTIPLRTCLDLLYNPKDNIRRNIEVVTDWRDKAAHLLMPEIQSIASRIFQSGVLNFSSEFEAFTEMPFISSQHTGMMSLVGEFKLPPASLLKTLYGSAAAEILELAQQVEKEIEAADDISFAIPLRVSLVFAKEEGDAQIVIAKANGSTEDLKLLRQALIVEKPVDPDKTHPLSQSKLLYAINEHLQDNYKVDKLERCLVSKDKTGKPALNNNCLQACFDTLKWKQGNNEFHYLHKMSNRRQYSMSAVEVIVKRVTEDENFLKQAKDKHNKAKNNKQPVVRS